MPEKLAIHGGKKAIPDGLVKDWPPVDDIDRKMVLASLESTNHAFGPNCVAFQDEFARWNGNKFGVTTNSGTAALHMAVYSCDCGVGTEVIVPSYSWSSSVTCVLHHNAIPVFVDIDYKTMNIDVSKIEAAITPRTKAVIVVHLHGLAVDMDKVMAVAKKHNLKVIEDCCQAHGAMVGGKKVGTIGHAAAFSCNQNKCLCSGEGGVFTTDDAEIFAKAKTLWSFGETRSPMESRDYHAYALGWMYRNNDLTAAFGRAQLSKIDGYLAQTRTNALRLAKCLAGTPHLILPEEPKGYVHNWYNYTIRFDEAALGKGRDVSDRRDKIVKALQAEGVKTGIWQKYMLPRMTVFQAKNGYGKGCPWSCPHSAPVDYSVEKFPMAQKHSDTHTGMTVPLRPPNGPEVAEITAAGIRKVMENLDQVLGS